MPDRRAGKPSPAAEKEAFSLSEPDIRSGRGFCFADNNF